MPEWKVPPVSGIWKGPGFLHTILFLWRIISFSRFAGFYIVQLVAAYGSKHAKPQLCLVWKVLQVFTCIHLSGKPCYKHISKSGFGIWDW